MPTLHLRAHLWSHNAVAVLRLSSFLLGALLMTTAHAAEESSESSPTVLDQTLPTLEGKSVDLKKYQGKVVLIVNTASECGLTPQYAELQALHEKYKDQGLAILGFPCNQFGSQEPGSSKEISEFCAKNYGVTFDMFEKVKVNGKGSCKLYQTLTGIDLKPAGSGAVSWNFEKFLIDRQGKPVARFKPSTAPNDPQIVDAIERLLAAK